MYDENSVIGQDVANNVSGIDLNSFGVLFNVNSIDVSAAKPSDKHKRDAEVAKMIAEANGLADKHETYAVEVAARSNKALYELLSEIYDFALRIDSSEHKEKIVEGMRKELHYAHKVKVSKHSPWMTIVVKSVVRSDRQTAFNYSRALQVAYEADVAVGEIASYIEGRGGIAKMTKTKAALAAQKAKQESLKARTGALRNVFIAEAECNNFTLASDYPVIQLPTNTGNSDPKKESINKRGDFVVFLGCWDYESQTYKLGRGFDLGYEYEEKLFNHIQGRIKHSTEALELMETKAIKKIEELYGSTEGDKAASE